MSDLFSRPESLGQSSESANMSPRRGSRRKRPHGRKSLISVDRDYPKQSTLLPMLLQEIDGVGGVARPGEIYDRLATRLSLTDDLRNATEAIGGRDVSLFKRHVRWTRQTACLRGLIDSERRGVWALTQKAKAHLQNIVRGTIITVFETDRGIALWSNIEDAVGIIERSSVDLIWTSPPYPLLRPKNYGNYNGRDWIEWMLKLCNGWRELLAPTGSMMLNLGPCWIPNRPQESLYIERLLVRLEDELDLHLCQNLYFNSPNKLPGPMEWVAIRRQRVSASVERVLWLASDPIIAQADNRRVLREYSQSGRRAIANPQHGVRKRPSGYSIGPSSFVDNGGSIPPSLITATNCASNSAYHRAERNAGRQAHPATAPDKLVEFCMKLTTQEDDLVMDPFAGSFVTAAVAEKLNRRWIGVERSRRYIESGRIRMHANHVQTRDIA